MFKGFYMATSGMLTQSRVLNTISNNMANASTPGYKTDVMTTTTFEDVLIHRTGNKDKSVYTPLNTSSMIRTVDELVTNYSEGTLEFTERPLDFAITGRGFFEVQNANGEARYTRNGSFNVDEDGYLCLQHIGRVMGANGPIYLGTDNINATKEGLITDADTGEALAQLRIVDFEDYSQLQKTEEGMFESINPAGAMGIEATIQHRAIERSNVEATDEMVDMIASQRAFQSASQIAKAYDQLMNRAADLASLTP